MAIEVKVPNYSYEQIRNHANAFLAQYHSTGVIPVPIEEITEFSLHLNIIPIPGIQTALEVDGFISSDFRSISVDQFVMERRERRYRFTLAHEIGHLWLHQEVLSKFRFDTVEGWKKFQKEIDIESYNWLEWQAYAFGGLVLAPKEALASRRAICKQLVSKEGLSPETEAAQFYISKMLARDFNVSEAVIEKRLQKDRER